MITVYVLESLFDSTLYVGMALDAGRRLLEHNSGRSKYTSGRMPWRIIYQESQQDWLSARAREKYLKTAAGKKWLNKYLNDHEGFTGSLSA